MDQDDRVCIYNGMVPSSVKEGNLAILTRWMDLEDILLSEISWTEKDKYCMFSLIRGIKIPKQTNVK